MTFEIGSVASIVDEGYATTASGFRSELRSTRIAGQEGVTATYKDRAAPGIAPRTLVVQRKTSDVLGPHGEDGKGGRIPM